MTVLQTAGPISPLNPTIQEELDKKVSTTRTVNAKALSTDISLNNSDIGLGNVLNLEQKIHHGFFTNPSIPTFSGTTVTVAGASTSFTVFVNGAKSLISTNKTIDLSTTSSWDTNVKANNYGQWFVFLKANLSLDANKTPWDILSLSAIPVCTVYLQDAGDVNYEGIVATEFHSYLRNLLEHKSQHDSWGAQYVSGFNSVVIGGGVPTVNSFSLTGGTFRDEDIYHVISNPQTQCRVANRGSGGSALIFSAAGTAYAKLDGNGYPYYDNNGTLTPVSNNNYGVYFLYATNHVGTPIVSIMGQDQYTSVGLAQAAPQPILTGEKAAEWKLLYRLIVRRTNQAGFSWIQSDPLFNVSTGPAINAEAISTISAGNVTYTPVSPDTSTNVQTALDSVSTLKAPIDAPTFTGIPAAPIAAVDTNTTQLATTAFVVGQAGTSNPLVNNTVAVGTSLRFSRQDHVHPVDTSRAPTSHATNASTYGYGDATNAGHVRVGNGISVTTGTISANYETSTTNIKMNGTVSVGALNTLARADHIHPVDTSREAAFSKNTAFNKNFGTATGTVCEGNDSRLSDARTPTSHSLTTSHTVTGLTTGHFLKATGASSFGFAAHGLSATDVGAAPTSHAHGNVTTDGKIGSTASLPIITGTSGVLEAGSFGTTTGTFCQGNDSRLSDARTPTSHTHGNITNVGAIGSTANLPLITTTSGVVTTGSFGTAVNTFCQGNDSRLSDARTPTSHATNAATYGYGDATNAGHLRVGNGISVTTGTISANYETSTTNIKMNGTVSVGVLNTLARADHVHPTDTGRVAANTAITAGTSTKITYDAKGLVTSGTSLAATDIPSLDAAKITSGTFDIARIPAAALERLVQVADQAARYALTTTEVQLGDTVKQLDTGTMYIVVDVANLDNAAGYIAYTAGSAASVPWSGVTDKPSTFTPSSHTHGNITNAGAIGSTANLPIITTTSGVLTAGSFGTAVNTFCQGNDSRLSDARTPTSHSLTTSHTVTGLTTGHFLRATGASSFGFAAHGLSATDVGAAATSHAHGNVTTDGKIGSTASLPIITGTSGVLEAGSFGTTTGTFCQGNDSRLSDARTPTSHTHGNITNVGAIGSTANLPLITTTSGVLTTGSFGTAANTFCQGNDSRLSDARTPTSHAVNASTYGYGDATNAGHVRVGNGISVTTGTISANYETSTTNIKMNGTVSVGVLNTLARADHVHPVDTSREAAFSKNTAFNKNFGTATGTVCEGNDSRLSDARTPTSHTHGNITNVGAIGSTANLPIITTTSGVLTAGSFGTAVNTFCQGNDSRLSDARTPTSHSLTSSHTVTGLTTGHFLKATGATTFGFAAHGLSATDVGAAATSHAHGNVTTDGKIGSTASLPIITGTSGVLEAGSFGTTTGTFCQGNDSRLSDARTPTSHTHGNVTNAGAIGSTANLPLITTTSGVLTTGSFGTAVNTFCQGNDSRLSDARTPTSHATNASTYGYGDATNAGHVRVGNGISVTTGTISANYETSTTNIKMNGTVSVGVLNTLARADHVHPADTGRVAANTAITAGTSTKITYDAKGLVTAGTSLAATDIPSLDAAKITSGTFDIARIPAAALERLVQVADQAARYALTTTEVQLGDTVKQLDTGIMYIVVDVANLGNAAGYVAYTAGSAASVPWSGVTDKPTTLSGYGITDAVPSSRTVNAKALSANITLTTSDIADSTDKRYCTDAQKTVIGNTSGTNSGNVTLATNHGLSLTNQVIGLGTPSSVTSTSTNSVTTTTHTHAIDSTIALIASPTFTGEPKAPTPIANSNSTLIATTAFVIGQAGNDNPLMNGAVSPGTGLKFARVDHCHASDTSRAPSSHAHGNLTSSGGIGASANIPIITGTGGLLQAGSFGTAVNTFCQGNDARLSDARTPTSHTHGNVTNVGAIGSTANLPIITTTSGVLTVGSFGTAVNTFCQGNDSRLSDARTPTSHSLTASHTVTGLTTGHFLKATGATTFGFAAHGLSATDVGAAPTSHATNAATYGYGDATNAGHVRVGNGISVTTGTISANYETSTTNIKMNGAVSVGALNTLARADHIHPVDTSRAAVAGSSSQDFATNNLTVAKKFVPGVGTVAAGATITIPNDYTIVVITNDSASAANLVTMPTGTNGQFLVIHNSDAQATTGQAVIPAGSTQMFIYVLSAWKPINAVVG